MAARRGGDNNSMLSKIANSAIVLKGKEVANDAGNVTMKLVRSTGNAAWVAGTWFLVLGVPLIIAMDREQQLNELKLQQASLLGSPSVGPPQ